MPPQRSVHDLLDTGVLERLRHFEAAFLRLNRRHRLMARGEDTHFWERHIRHSLALCARPFPSSARVVDWGTGGGLPALPLAIAQPSLHVIAVDSVQKKVWAVRLLVRELGLDNVDTWCGRAQEYPDVATHSISRATACLATLWQWHQCVAAPGARNQARSDDTEWAPGLLCLKGGDLSSELHALRRADDLLRVTRMPLDHMGPWFRTKAVVHVHRP